MLLMWLLVWPFTCTVFALLYTKQIFSVRLPMPGLTAILGILIIMKERNVAVEKGMTVAALMRIYLERLVAIENLKTEGVVL
jgi:hypothetical protein